MEPDCRLCGVRESECKCDPKDVEIARLRARCDMLETALRGWMREYGTAEQKRSVGDA